jgi:hypothetical protein
MKQLSLVEIRVKSLVDDFFADVITHDEFKRELAKEKIGLRSRQKIEKKSLTRKVSQAPRH